MHSSIFYGMNSRIEFAENDTYSFDLKYCQVIFLLKYESVNLNFRLSKVYCFDLLTTMLSIYRFIHLFVFVGIEHFELLLLLLTTLHYLI